MDCSFRTSEKVLARKWQLQPKPICLCFVYDEIVSKVGAKAFRSVVLAKTPVSTDD
jgi:hypothetical protein